MKRPLFLILFVSIFLLGYVLHWSLPREMVISVTGSMTKRDSVASVDIGSTPDLYFISGTHKGKPIMLRNEDTGWSYPPYFKFNSAEIQADAQRLTKTDGTGTSCVVRYYGWRNKFFGIFPNIISLKESTDNHPSTRVPTARGVVFFALFLLCVCLVPKILSIKE